MSAQIFIALLPIIGTLLFATIFAVLALRRVNLRFLTILGGGIMILGRGFLLIPDETLFWYYVAMILLCGGMPPFLVGLIGTYMYPTELEGDQSPPKILVFSLFSGLILATSLSLLLRAPGLELMEQPAVVIVLVLVDVVSFYRWSVLFPRGRSVRSDSPPNAKKTPFPPHSRLRSLVILVLVPAFFYLINIFDRPEWIAVTTQVPYGWTSYVIALSLVGGGLCASISPTKQFLNILSILLNGMGFLGLGLMFYLPSGPYLLIFAAGGAAGIAILLVQLFYWWQNNREIRPHFALFLAVLSLLVGSSVFFTLRFLYYMPYLPTILSGVVLSTVIWYQITSKQVKGEGD